MGPRPGQDSQVAERSLRPELGLAGHRPPTLTWAGPPAHAQEHLPAHRGSGVTRLDAGSDRGASLLQPPPPEGHVTSESEEPC